MQVPSSWAWRPTTLRPRCASRCAFCSPTVPWFDDAAALYADASIDLIATAAIPVRRGEIAIAALEAGKDVVTDKPGVVTQDQLETIKKLVAEKGRFWDVVFSERFGVRSAIKAGELVHSGRIGRVVQTLGLGPHRERDAAHLSGGSGRPDWFYDISTFGGILNDIASHQIDQFLWLTGSTKGDVVAATVANFNHPEHPDFQDFGDIMLSSDSAQGYVRVDWFTPQGLPTWGDGRLVIVGTEGYIELRKYVDIEGRPGTDHLFVADQNGTEYIDCSDVELTFFSDVVSDVVNRTTRLYRRSTPSRSPASASSPRRRRRYGGSSELTRRTTYRNARRSGLSLTTSANRVEACLSRSSIWTTRSSTGPRQFCGGPRGLPRCTGSDPRT